MSALITLSLDLTQIDKTKLRDGKFLDLNLSVSDENKLYGNVSASYSQTKEQYEAKAKKEYPKGCFSKVIWTDGKCTKWEKPTDTPKIQENEGELPWE
jgi:hypothetical protein